MKNKIEDLRNMLFDTMERLLNPEDETRIDLDTAKQITDTAQVIVNSAKVEVDFMKAVGADRGSGFIDTERRQLPKAH